MVKTFPSTLQFVFMTGLFQAIPALGTDLMLPNLPAIRSDYALPPSVHTAAAITVYLIGVSAAQLIFGVFSDRYGRRPVIIASLVLFGAASITAMAAPSFETLLVARFVQGCGAAGLQSVGMAIIRDVYSGRRMARILSFASIVVLIGPMIAPSIGQLIGLFASWRWIFAFLLLISICTFLWVVTRLPETLQVDNRRSINPDEFIKGLSIVVRSRAGMTYSFARAAMAAAVLGFVNSAQPLFAQGFRQPLLLPPYFAVMAAGVAAASLINGTLVERIGMRPLAHGATLALIVVSVLHCAIIETGGETIYSFAALQTAQMFFVGLVSGNFASMSLEPLGDVAGMAAAFQGTAVVFIGAVVGYFIGNLVTTNPLPITEGYAVCSFAALCFALIAEGGRLFRTNHADPAPHASDFF